MTLKYPRKLFGSTLDSNLNSVLKLQNSKIPSPISGLLPHPRRREALGEGATPGFLWGGVVRGGCIRAVRTRAVLLRAVGLLWGRGR